MTTSKKGNNVLYAQYDGDDSNNGEDERNAPLYTMKCEDHVDIGEIGRRCSMYDNEYALTYGKPSVDTDNFDKENSKQEGSSISEEKNQGDEINRSLINDQISVIRTTDDLHIETETDLQEMGENVDIGEIGRRCSRFDNDYANNISAKDKSTCNEGNSAKEDKIMSMYEEKGKESKEHNTSFSINQSTTDQESDIEIDFEELDKEIKDAIESIENLSYGGSVGSGEGNSINGSLRTRNSTIRVQNEDEQREKSKEADDTDKWKDATKLVIKNSNWASRNDKKTTDVVGLLYQSNFGSKRGYASEGDILKFKDVQNVSSIVNNTMNERRGFQSSINGLDLGIVRSVGRNVDLSNGNKYSGGNETRQYTSRSQLISQSDEFSNLKIYTQAEKWRILRNLVFISLAFMILFTAFNTTENLQSSVNSKEGLGSLSLVAYYFTFMVSNMFLPVVIIKWLGCKWSMVVSCILYAPYIVAQFYPRFYTFIPASFIAGLGAGTLFCAQGTYSSVMAEAYMTVTGADKETTMMLFFGIFFFLFLMSTVWGNLISAEVLLTGRTSPPSHMVANLTSTCGANFCPDTVASTINQNLMRPPDEKLFIIWGILLALVVLSAAVMAAGVDSLSRYNEVERSNKKRRSGCQLLASSLKQLTNPYQLLLIPISALVSVSQGILGADFTYGYISCVWGIPHIGYVMSCYGTFLLCFTLLLGCFAVRIVGRLPLVLSCLALYVAVLATLKFWPPSAELNVVFYVIAGVWGVADASTVIITAMYGIVFLGNEEAAFCNLGISRSAGYLLSYAIHPYLCMDIKLIIFLVFVLVSSAGYGTFEFLWKKTASNGTAPSLVPIKKLVGAPGKVPAQDKW